MSENTPKKETETTTKHVTSLPSAHHPQTLGAAAATSFSQLLAGAMESPTASPRGGEVPSFPGQFAMTHQAVLATVTAQAQMDLQTPEALTTDSFQQPVLTPISPSSLHGTPEGNSSIPQAEEPPLTSDPKGQSAQTVGRPNPTDGYNWRKYGQKQVKSSDRSRSYYKCTDANCSAKKKVENGPDGKDTEITYSGQHNHGRPKKKHLKGRGTQPGGSTRPSRENEPLGLPVGGGGEVNDSTTSKTKHVSGIKSPEPPVYCSSDGEGEAEEEHDDEPDPKRRLSESIIPYSEPVMRMAKEPKIVVQSSCDMSRIDDGYRWRKYGQKIVKGNPNPRSYYRCTHNGCPVRKHVERASDDYKAILITYEGKHNHDQPPQQKDGDQSNTAVLIAAAVASVNNDEGVYQSNSFDRNNDAGRDGSKSKELRGALKPAQTLLSIGLNSSTGERASGTNSDGNNHGPLFNKNRSTIPVQNS